MIREEAITVLRGLYENPLFSNQHKAAFSIAIHDIKVHHDWDINNLILINKDNYESLEQEPTTKNDLGVDREQLKTMIRGLTKWYVKRDNTEVGEPNTAVGLLYDDVMFGIDRLPSVTSIRPKGHWEKIELPSRDAHVCSECGGLALSGEYGDEYLTDFCPNCGADMRGDKE